MKTSKTERKRAEEFHLLPLLESQFPDMAKSYTENLNALMAAAESCPNLEWFREDSKPLFFRLDIDLPAFFLISEPLSRFHAYKQYIVPLSEEHKFYTGIGIIPAYFANLNRISCVKLWGNDALGFFAPYSQPLRAENESIWQFGAGVTNPAKFSSLNFVLRNGATETTVQEHVKTALSDYFRYSFWSFPKKGFSASAHIIHSRENINHILKVAKGIYLVKYIHEASFERLGPYYSGWVQRVDLETFNRHGESITFSVYMARDVIPKIWTEIDLQNKSQVIINGLIYDFRTKAHDANERLRLLSVAADFMPSDVELLKTLTCFCAAEKFHFDKETVGQIGSIEELKSEVFRRYAPFARKTDYSSSILTQLEQPIEYIIDELYPMLVENGNNAFFVHPVIISSLTALNADDSLRTRNKMILTNFVLLLERFKLARELQTLRFTDEAEYFKEMGIEFQSLLAVVRLAFRSIVLSKRLSQYF